MVKRRVAKTVNRGEIISVRFPSGTTKQIKEVSESICFGRSVSDYVKECVLTNLNQDVHIVQERNKIEGRG